MRPHRGVKIGLEIAPDAVRAVALSTGRRPRLLAHAERKVDSLDDVASILPPLLEELGMSGEIRIVVHEAGARHLHLTLPKMGRKELHEAISIQAAQQLGSLPEGFLEARRVWKSAKGIGHEVGLIYLPIEPIETWIGVLLAAECSVHGITTPAGLIMGRSKTFASNGCLWADVGAERTVLTLLAPSGAVALTREIPRRLPSDDDLLATTERRLADFQEIERSLMYYRQEFDRRGIQRVIVCSAVQESEGFKQQIAPPLRELGIEIEEHRAWEGIDLGDLDDGALLCRLAIASRAAAAPSLAWAVRVAGRSPTRRGDLLQSAAAAAGLALAAASYGYMDHQLAREHELAEALENAQRKLDEIPIPQNRRDPSEAFAMQAAPVANWGAVLREAGLLARPGIDYVSLDLDLSRSMPLLRLAGRIESRGAAATGQLFAKLHDGVRNSPYVVDLPKVSASAHPPGGRGERMNFVVESSVIARPENGS